MFTSGTLGGNSGDCSGLASLQMNRWPINQKRPWPGIPETNPRGAGTNSKSEALAVQLLNSIGKPERLATRFLFFFRIRPPLTRVASFDGREVYEIGGPSRGSPVLRVYQPWMLERARGRTLIVNDPRGLREQNEKLAVLEFPELCPPTIVTRGLPSAE